MKPVDAAIWPTNSHFDTPADFPDFHWVYTCLPIVVNSTTLAAHPITSAHSIRFQASIPYLRNIKFL